MLSKKVYVIGGGTAGWLTALYLKKTWPQINITVIESHKIGVIGAGESVTMHFNALLNYVGISKTDFLKNTGSTIKSAVRFDNWDLSGGTMVAPMYPWSDIIWPGGIYEYFKWCISNDIDIASRGSCSLSLDNKSPYFYDKYGNIKRSYEYTFHIDGVLTSQYLKNIGLSRGISLIEGIVSDITSDKNQNVIKILLDDGSIHNPDFVFDCTGFSRLFIGKHFNIKWNSFSDKLKTNSVVLFQKEMTNDIPPYGRNTALDYGWKFEVPTYNKYGCGYVYDGNLISSSDAISELNKKFDYNLSDLREIKFDPGMYDTPWVGNVIALGLAGSFLEPMSATNLGDTCKSLNSLGNIIGKDFSYTNKSRQKFNRSFTSNIINSLNLVYCHFMQVQKIKSKFWDQYTEENWPQGLKNKLLSHDPKMLTVIQGKKIFLDELLKSNIKDFTIIDNKIVKNTEKLRKKLMTHREYLEMIHQ